jgi:alpha-beta hydrolase superfamily lysophospholipase
VAVTVGVLVLAIVGVGCGTNGAARVHGAQETATPGTLISSTPVTASGVNGTAYLVKYWSESSPANKPVAVTGLVVEPTGTPPPGGWPVVTWAHGTDGMNSVDSPSADPALDIPNVNNLLANHWEVTATDYVGMGNPLAGTTQTGFLPYLVGVSAARNSLDIVRAVHNSSLFHASANYVVWGHSEGGQTAMYALDIAASYAPTLSLKGVMAFAPPSNLATLIPAVGLTSNWPLLFLLVGGFNEAYGNTLAPTQQILTPTGQRDLMLLNKASLVALGATLRTQGYRQVFTIPQGGPLPPAWQSLANENDAAGFASASAAPLVIVSGHADTLVIPSTTAALATELCRLTPAQNLERWLYAGLDHAGIVGDQQQDGTPAIGDFVAWTAQRFAGTPPHSYQPTGMAPNTPTVTNSCE